MSDPATAMMFFSAMSASAQASAGGDRASILRRQGIAEEQASEFEARQYAKSESANLATARARRADSGVAFTGTPLIVDEATVQEIALNEENIRRQGIIRGQNLRTEGSLARREGTMRGFNTLLQGASTWQASQPPKPK